MALTPDERRLFIAYGQSGKATPTVVRVDAATEKVISTFVVGNRPHNISLQQTVR